MSAKTIYLDHNATTPLDPRVAESMASCERTHFGNPASQHAPGRLARRALEDARERIGRHLGVNLAGQEPDRIVFTSGATESNHLALLGLAGRPPGQILISTIEHPSVTGAAGALARNGFQIDLLPVDARGVVRVDALQEILTASTRLVSVMLGNNETGAMQPVKELATLCRRANVPLHTDASQVVGKLAVDFRGLGVSALSATAHKFHGPRGVGVLLLSGGLRIEPLFFGGHQQWGLRPGTESVSLPIGMAAALDFWYAERDDRLARLTFLRDEFEAALCRGWPDLVVHAAEAERLPHTSCVALPGLDRQAMLMVLDLAGVACSSGSACASGSSEPSTVLRAMGCGDDLLSSSLRFSFGAFTTEAEIVEAASCILFAAKRLRDGFQEQKSAAPGPSSAAKRV